MLLQLFHQDLGTEGHTDTHKGRESGGCSAAAPPPRPIPSSPVPSPPARPGRSAGSALTWADFLQGPDCRNRAIR